MSHAEGCGCSACSVQVNVPAPINVVVSVQNVVQSTQGPIVVRPGQGGAAGIQGTQGIQGLQGPIGPDKPFAYAYTQYSPSSVWSIAHNLNFYPNVTTLDSSGAICEGEIDYIDSNNIRVTFLAAFSGTAYLS